MKNTKSVNSKITETQTPESKTTQKSETKTVNKSKNMFDILIEAQTKFVDTLVENSKKFTESFGGNTVVEKSRTFVNEFLEKQQSNLENTVATLKKQVGFENAPELVKEAVAVQEELGKAWFEVFKATLKVNDAKELNSILTANVNKLQENLKTVANFWVESFGKPVNVAEIFTVEYAKDVTKKVTEMLKPAAINQ